jgi:predicted DNA-binding protein (MmcQ/YjbR family)
VNVSQLKRHCRELPYAEETQYTEPWNWLVYSVGGRKFAYFKTSQPERWRFSVRVAPDRFVELTDVPGVKPARYRGRFHWITIVTVSSFPAAYLEELVGWSYRKAFGSLSKAAQRACARMADAQRARPRKPVLISPLSLDAAKRNSIR